jgi:N utilization substance protein A
MKGIRIHSIVRELQNENIDVINYADDKVEFIRRALQPAEILNVELNEDQSHAKVLVPADQVSKAIGRGGVNIRLASKLTECEIDVYREIDEEDDIDIFEFEEDFGEDTVQLLFDIGCDSARAVLDLGIDELIRRTDGDIDEEEAARIFSILELEFEDEGGMEEEI